VLALNSLKYQWSAEVAKFTASRALVIDGTPKQRAEQWSRVHQADYVIVNYEALTHDWDRISTITWGAIVADEAHALKSFRAKRSIRAKELATKVPIRIAMTGTPVENGKAEEIFSIMEFVDPKVLGKFWHFDRRYIVRNRFGGVERYQHLPELRERLFGSMLRKTQDDPDVAPYLPEEIHKPPLVAPMTRAVRGIYKRVVADLLVELANMKRDGSWSLAAHYGVGTPIGGHDERGRVMSMVTALRMLVQHPGLLLTANNAYVAELLDSQPRYLTDLTKAAEAWPKMQLAGDYIVDHLEADDGHKVVVFASYLGVVSHLEGMLQSRGYPALQYTGRMNAKERDRAKERFQTDPAVRVLVSSDAGGYGVDLPQANLLVNYDLPWSSGAALQRNARVRRASSLWPHVVIQDVLVADSIEERLHDMLTQKDGVADAIVDGRAISAQGTFELTLGTLSNFLTAH
jgi:SNF2 family DNA or RNA helicase